MKGFDEFFLMAPEDAGRYAAEVLHFFGQGEALECSEIGDGNINYVFRVKSKESGRSVILKQADRLLRSSQRPLDTYRSAIEAKALQAEGSLAPGFVPEIYSYNETMALIAMEDVSGYRNLRSELMAGRIYPHLADNLSEFLARALFPTTDLVLSAEDKKRSAAFFVNPELCAITEDLVFAEPYLSEPLLERNRNKIFPGNEDYVREHLFENAKLHCEVAKLRDRFMTCSQALLHGDLHSGSVFANESGIKILNPEFAFYGPMGYDIGNVIGNLFFSLAYSVFAVPESADVVKAIRSLAEKVYDLTFSKMSDIYDEKVSFPLYAEPEFKKSYLSAVRADAAGYAGTEIIRRTVGDAKVAEISSVTDPSVRLPMERALIELGTALITGRERVSSGCELTELFGKYTENI